MQRSALSTAAVLLGISLAVGGCTYGAAHGTSSALDGQLITREAITSSGAANAWDVVRRFAIHMHLAESATGAPVRVQRRGRESVHLPENPLLIIDGASSDFRALHLLPARDLQSIRIMTATQATTRYGMQAASGAIIVQTRRSNT